MAKKFKKIRLKQCKGCKGKFTPYTTTQVACCPVCALFVAEQARNKREEREQREAKQSLKTLGDRKGELQIVFNRWIRTVRDKDDPCISCGRYDFEITHNPRGGKWDCGHFHTVGSRDDLRFNEDNAHKQCKYCNDRLKANHGPYRIALIDKIGIEAVEKLDGPHELIKWDKEELILIKKDYQKRIREAR